MLFECVTNARGDDGWFVVQLSYNDKKTEDSVHIYMSSKEPLPYIPGKEYYVDMCGEDRNR